MLSATVINHKRTTRKKIECKNCKIQYTKKDYDILYENRKLAYFSFPPRTKNIFCHDCFYEELVNLAEEKEKEIQDKINVNPDAIKWKEDAEKKNTNQDDDGDIDYDYITKGGITGGYISSPVDLHGSPAKDLKSPPHRHPHPDDKTQEAQRKQEEEYVPSKKTQEVVKSTGKTKTKKTKSTKNEEKLNKLYNKRASLKSEGGDVEGGDGVDRKLRRVQNKINRLLDDPTRHKRNIFTGGKYKKVVKN